MNVGCLTFIFYQKYFFYDKMYSGLFRFHVMNAPLEDDKQSREVR